MNRPEFAKPPLLGELEALLAGVEPGREALPRLMNALRESLRAERTLAYGVDVGPEQYQASFCHGAGFAFPSGVLHDALNTFLPTLQDPWGFFNPARPEAAQRNRALLFRPVVDMEAEEAPLHDVRAGAWRKLGISPAQRGQVQARVSAHSGSFLQRMGLERMFQLRTLVCDGPVLLAWVGALRAEPFSPGEVRLFQALTPALQRRLRLERRLREAGLLTAALEAALDALPQPAYLLTLAGRAVHANAAGKARLKHASRNLSARLRQLVRGEADGQDLCFTPLKVPGLPMHYLVLERGAPAHAFARVQTLARRWGLTARETEVLERIVQGETNKAIAARLGCAERTVEVHVTHVLGKARAESRSALIARFFQSS